MDVFWAKAFTKWVVCMPWVRAVAVVTVGRYQGDDHHFASYDHSNNFFFFWLIGFLSPLGFGVPYHHTKGGTSWWVLKGKMAGIVPRFGNICYVLTQLVKLQLMHSMRSCCSLTLAFSCPTRNV